MQQSEQIKLPPRKRKEPPAVPKGVRTLCAGLLQAEKHLSPVYQEALRQGEQALQQGFGPSPETQTAVKNLAAAVRLNLENPQRWPYETLYRKYLLPVSARQFYREKQRFCRGVAAALELLAAPAQKLLSPGIATDIQQKADAICPAFFTAEIEQTIPFVPSTFVAPPTLNSAKKDALALSASLSLH